MTKPRQFWRGVVSCYPKWSGGSPVLIFLAAVVPAHSATPQKPLRSPWDGKSVTMTGATYACPAIVHIAPDLVTDGFYRLDDPTHSIIDPVRQEAYRKSSDGVKSVGLEIVKAADTYRSTGSKQAAQCAMNQILTLARSTHSPAKCPPVRPTMCRDGLRAQSQLTISKYAKQGWQRRNSRR
jgi:hypothetical protein